MRIPDEIQIPSDWYTDICSVPTGYIQIIFDVQSCENMHNSNAVKIVINKTSLWWKDISVEPKTFPTQN